MLDEPKGSRDDTHDRILRIEVEMAAWRQSVERRLGECSTMMKWIWGIVAGLLIATVSALVARGTA